jgi:hypothetical protein
VKNGRRTVILVANLQALGLTACQSETQPHGRPRAPLPRIRWPEGREENSQICPALPTGPRNPPRTPIHHASAFAIFSRARTLSSSPSDRCILPDRAGHAPRHRGFTLRRFAGDRQQREADARMRIPEESHPRHSEMISPTVPSVAARVACVRDQLVHGGGRYQRS